MLADETCAYTFPPRLLLVEDKVAGRDEWRRLRLAKAGAVPKVEQYRG